jgi:hypothetical protein
MTAFYQKLFVVFIAVMVASGLHGQQGVFQKIEEQSLALGKTPVSNVLIADNRQASLR